nr:DUF6544 family protein [Microcoleus sp. LEGE 07076]
MTESGLDITRSAIGRLQSESVCLPSVFCVDNVSWTSPDSSHLDSLHFSFVVQDERAELDFTIDQTGRLKTCKLPRWGNPEGAEFHYVDFGGILEEESTFSGYTIPTRLWVGWYFGSDRFESEGEFFGATIDDAIYR